MMSGRPVERFREGWALKAFTFGKAHYFRRKGAGIAVSICGSQDAPAGRLFEVGSWKLCSRCAKLRDREISQMGASAARKGQDAR